MIAADDLFGRQRLGPDQLPDSGFDAVQAPEDLHRAADPRRLPTGHRLELSEHLVEAIAQVGEHMVGIDRDSMAGVDRRRRTTNQNSIGE